MRRFIGALMVWLLALLGAIALAVWLRLPATETRALVILSLDFAPAPQNKPNSQGKT